jgi:hypothetical protein
MKNKYYLRYLATLVALSGGPLPVAVAAPIQPVLPIPRGSNLPPDSRCTVEALNVGGIVNADGSIYIPNVPGNPGQVRVWATCTDPLGNTSRGQSTLVSPLPGGVVDVGSLNFDGAALVAAKLRIEPRQIRLQGIDATQQLRVIPILDGEPAGNVTTASGTIYRTTNGTVATVSSDGLVTARGSGTAIVSAQNDGVLGLATVTVSGAPVTTLDPTPASIAISLNPAFPAKTVQLRVLGLLADGSEMDMTRATSGIVYTSLSTAVARVSPDGEVVGVGGGSTTIRATDPQTGITAQIPVSVSAFTPSPIMAYNTTGCAYNVDIDGSRTFVADGTGGLQIYNIVMTPTPSVTPLGKLTFISPAQQAVDVKVRGTLAAVALASGTACIPYASSFPNPGGFALVDVSKPTLPALLSRVNLPVSVRDLWISGHLLYLAAGDGLYVYNISNPSAPTLVGSKTGFSAGAVAADATSSIAVVTTTAGQVRVIRTSGSAPWPEAAPITLPVADYRGDDILLFGTSAFIANGTDGLREIDLTDSQRPVLKEKASTSIIAASGIALRRTRQGTLVAAADVIYQNAVLLFDGKLTPTYTIDFATFPGVVLWDANGWGIALGEGYGVEVTAEAGIQVFGTQEIFDNAGVPPIVSISQPVDGSGLMPSMTNAIEATAFDDVGVAYVEFSYDNGALAHQDISIGFDSDAPFSVEFSPDGPCTTYTLKARAVDDYGNPGEALPVQANALCLEGQPCASDSDCANHVCTSNVCQASCNLIYGNCEELKNACPAAVNGAYFIDPDGAGGQPAFQVYCEMRLAEGGWTLAAKLTNQDAKQWVNASSSWTGTSSYGTTINLTSGNDAKSAAWGRLPATEMLFTDNEEYQHGSYIVTTSNCLEDQTLSRFFTAALVSYPAPGEQSWYKECQVTNNYTPGWTLEPDYLSDGNSATPNNSLSHSYLSVARAVTDAFGDNNQAVISFYPHEQLLYGPLYHPVHDTSGELRAAVGLAASDRNGAAFTTVGEGQDIGGALNCLFDDPTCRTSYPQTVFIFVR